MMSVGKRCTASGPSGHDLDGDDFMDAHKEGVIGLFTSSDVAVNGPDGDTLGSISGTVWLAPYDLGVRQDFRIYVIPDADDVCSIGVELKFGSGQEHTWWRLNKTFLGQLRRQLLGWRNISAERMVRYIQEAPDQVREGNA